MSRSAWTILESILEEPTDEGRGDPVDTPGYSGPDRRGFNRLNRSVSNMAQNIETLGIDGCNDLYRGIGVDVHGVGMAKFLKAFPSGECLVVHPNGERRTYPPEQVWPAGGGHFDFKG